VTLEFVRDRDLKGPLKPVFMTAAFGMKPIGLKGDDVSKPLRVASGGPGPSCDLGEHAPNATQHNVHSDPKGTFSSHWLVRPGKEILRTPVTQLLSLPSDTTVHFVSIHVHPFAQSLELRDLTTGKTIFKSRVKGLRRGIGLSRVTHFSSRKGIALLKDHEYELVSVYNNTSGVNQDSMAGMLLYLLDKNFKKPPAAQAVAPLSH